MSDAMGLLGILLALGLLIFLAFRGWSVLLLAPAAALVAAAAAGEPLLAHWTETFMGGAAKFLAQFFPLFLLGALFGKLMDDSGSVETIARFVSLFVAFLVLAPMAQSLFKAADIPHRLVPPAVALGTMTFTMSALPGTPALQNAIPMPFFGTTPFAAPGLGIIAAAIMLGFCGGSASLKPPRAAPAKATASMSRSTWRRRNSRRASAPPSPANSIPPRLRTAATPNARRACSSPSCR